MNLPDYEAVLRFAQALEAQMIEEGISLDGSLTLMARSGAHATIWQIAEDDPEEGWHLDVEVS